jgi:hypothetical protein
LALLGSVGPLTAAAGARGAGFWHGVPGAVFLGDRLRFVVEVGCDVTREPGHVTARDTDGPIKPCTGLIGYGGDTERVYLLLTQNPALPHSHVTSLATSIRSTGIGRAPRYSWRDGRLLVESAPSVVADLARRIELITFTVDSRQVPAVSSVDHLTAEAGRIIIAENYAAYVAEYGEPA